MLPTCGDITSPIGKLLAVRFLLYVGDPELASQYLHPLAADDSRYDLPNRVSAPLPHAFTQTEATTLYCWLALYTYNQSPSPEHQTALERCAQNLDAYEGDDIEMLMVKSSCRTALKQYDAALESLNQLCAVAPWYHPALIDKAAALGAKQDWDQVGHIHIPKNLRHPCGDSSYPHG